MLYVSVTLQNDRNGFLSELESVFTIARVRG